MACLAFATAPACTTCVVRLFVPFNAQGWTLCLFDQLDVIDCHPSHINSLKKTASKVIVIYNYTRGGCLTQKRLSQSSLPSILRYQGLSSCNSDQT